MRSADSDPVALAPTASAGTRTTSSTPGEPIGRLAIGDRLADRYAVDAFLGQGGMGVVYRARDEQLGEHVALKIVRGTATLRDEVRLAQKVTHPNVCRTYDLQQVGDQHFVTMEYVAGETLAARLRREGKLAVGEAVRIARAIADGLAAAHAQGIVHRDLKPGNVMIASSRTVLMDFGIAQQLSSANDMLAGTRGYMAPELLDGGGLDERADLYALGCVLFEMLTGKLREDARDLRTERPDTPRWLAHAVTALLARDRSVRPAGIARLRRGARSRWPIAAAIAIPMLAAAAGLAWHATRRPSWRPQIVDLMPQLQENGDAPSFSPDGTQIAYSSDQNGTMGVYIMPASGGDGQLISPQHVEASGGRWTRDGKELLYLRSDADGDSIVRHRLLDHHEGVEQRGLRGGTWPEACGDAIVFVSADRQTQRLVMQSPDRVNHVLVRFGFGEMITAPRCDLAGRRVAFARGAGFPGQYTNDVFVVDRAGNVRQLTVDHRAGQATIAPDGSSVVYSAERDGKRHLFEVSVEGGPSHQLTFDDGWDAMPDVSPDGTRVVFLRDTTSQIPYMGVADGVDRAVIKSRGTLEDTRTLPDGRRLVAARADGDHWNIVAITIDDGREQALARGRLPIPSRDGALVYFRNPDDPHQLDAIAIGGGVVKHVASLPAAIELGLAASDGIHVWCEDGSAFLLDDSGVVIRDHAQVVPAPSGGWRVRVDPTGDRTSLQLIGPDGEPRGDQINSASPVPTWIDASHLGYCLVDECRVVDITTGNVGWSCKLGDAIRMTVGPDGHSWFGIVFDGRVTRHVLVNFADRPWNH